MSETVTTAAVREAAGVSLVTVHRWAKQGLLPAPEKIFRGRWGTAAAWPMMVMGIPNVGRSTPIIALIEAIARGRGCAVARLSRPHARPLQSGDAGETTAAAE